MTCVRRRCRHGDGSLSGLIGHQATLDTLTESDSEGSAERELTNYQKGIDYSLERFKATFQEFSTSVLSSDTFKAVIDSGTQFLEILTKITETLGPLGTALTALGGFKFISSIG